MNAKARWIQMAIWAMALAITFFPFGRPNRALAGTREDRRMREHQAIQRSLRLLQASARRWPADCVSCHHQALELVTTRAAQAQHFVIDDNFLHNQQQAIETALSRSQPKMNGAISSGQRPPAQVSPNPAMIFGYSLLALAETHVQRNDPIDATLRYLRLIQQPSGNWKCEVRQRPPFEASDFAATALMAKAEQQFGARLEGSGLSSALQSAREWLLNASPTDTEDLSFRLLGLYWTRAPRQAIAAAAGNLLSQQRPDGGWAQTQALTTDAYATGEALVALRTSGMVDRNSLAFKKGVDYLLRMQVADGSWYVKSRAEPIQTYFETGFPYGKDQFISYTATCWATLALLSDADSSALE